MDDNFQKISWEIKPAEKRKQIQRFILRTWSLWIGLVVFSLFYYVTNFFSWALSEGIKFALNRVLYVVIGVIGSILLLFILNLFLPYKKRTYSLDDKGLAISKGKKKKYFLWSEFECFYPYRSYSQDQRFFGEESKERIFETARQIEGKIFYLEKKRVNTFTRFYKVFVVIYSEPDNAKSVLDLLARHLPKKTMKSTSDLGLVFYQFK